ncbi:polysaccharide deacetylase family protein [Permianibacter aggregans]|uniref:Polysaccharide deacetylase n=1 Tax=Permianibacter aggregans TaxID=1510150 RepID=A0A4R6UQ78_9GAMM|nr:polysaccharide deacetylase family protein [Permianibacter aggregans]QGX40093.1 polysaccharide deacetylase family protein [Permianibacter aggregans]TDQ49092.1 polysaccharide deacetylase [Permianibacter aggregans]
MFHWLYRLRLLPRRHYTFIFHRLVAERDPLMRLTPTVDEFRQQLALICEHFDVIPLSESLAAPRSGKPTASISFDDGYADNLHLLVPVLREFKANATVFACTAFLDGDLMWNDWLTELIRQSPAGPLDLSRFGLATPILAESLDLRRSVLAKLRMAVKYWQRDERRALVSHIRDHLSYVPRLMLNENELKTLHEAGVTIGGHTHDHHVLSTLDDDEAEWQIQHNRGLLSEILGEAPTLFAYPNGKPEQDYRAVHVRQVKQAGYQASWTTEHGAWTGRGDRFQIPRFTPWNWNTLPFTRDLAQVSFRKPQVLDVA